MRYNLIRLAIKLNPNKDPKEILDTINKWDERTISQYYHQNRHKLSEALDKSLALKTIGGSPIKRYKNLVGKQMGKQLYVHRDYASKVIPVNLLQRATATLRKYHPEFRFNTIMLDADSDVVRFDEAPDFDTAREPHVGKVIAVFPDGSTKTGYSNNIWHHKWLWVMDDYTGFDVNKSREWSKLWLSKVSEPAKGTDESWRSQLKQVGLNESSDDDIEHSKALQSTGFWGKEGAGCIFLARDTGRILLQFRSSQVLQPHTWGTWGGAIDAGEDPKDAVRREVEEETGYSGKFGITHLWTFEKDSFRYHNFLVIVEKEFEPELGWEGDGFEWVDFGDWPSPLHFGLKSLLDRSGSKIKRYVDRLTLREWNTLRTGLSESDQQSSSDIESLAKSKGYTIKTYRGDVGADEIFNYSPKERREHGIFTTPEKEVAAIYAGGRSKGEPRLFYVKAPRILNLLDDSLENMRWVERWGESFDEWRDPRSGEEVTAWDVLSGGQMFDYEGDWSSERWMDIQATAENDGYDAVVLPDYDSQVGIFPSIVVFDEKNLKLADPTTFDDNGNPIPLNRRYDDRVDDIRY